MGRKSIAMIIGAAVLGLFILIFGAKLIDSNKSGQFIVKQAAWTGKMSSIINEGVLGQFWGDLNRYDRSASYYFSAYLDEGEGKNAARNESIPVTFKNGSLGTVSGSIRFDYPVANPKMLVEIHRKYQGPLGVKNDLIRTEVRKLITTTASLMSPEAAMTQKGLFLQRFADQLYNGQYRTVPAKEEYIDPISEKVTYRDIVKIAEGEDGQKLRMKNPFAVWKINISQPVIQLVEVDKTTKLMISKRRDSEMKVMIAKADVQKERQEKLRVEAEGKKNVAQEKYDALRIMEKETINAKREKQIAEIGAQRKVEVAKLSLEEATLDKQKAEQEKLAKIERGTGEAKARELVMAADNALDRKLQTYERVMAMFAQSFATRKVPTIVAGGGAGGVDQDKKFLGLTELLSYKIANELALDLNLGNTKLAGDIRAK